MNTKIIFEITSKQLCSKPRGCYHAGLSNAPPIEQSHFLEKLLFLKFSYKLHKPSLHVDSNAKSVDTNYKISL